MIIENFNTYTFEFLSKVKDKLTEFKKDPDPNVFESIGSAMSFSVEQAIFSALQHKEKFLDQVVGYRIKENDKVAGIMKNITGKEYVGVEFYKLKTSS